MLSHSVLRLVVSQEAYKRAAHGIKKPNKKTDEAIMPSPNLHEPCSTSLNRPSMPTIKAIHTIILIADGTMNDSLLFSPYRLP